MASETNPYACLGLLPGSTQADIKRRYRQLAKQYHPDRNRNAAYAEAKLREINAAYSLLSHPDTRSAYDRSFDTIFNPVRPPMPDVSPRRRRARTAALLAALLLLSTGLGYVLRTEGGSPALAQLFAPKTAVPDRPTPPYSFTPSRGTFDDPSNPSAPDQNAPAQGGLP